LLGWDQLNRPAACSDLAFELLAEEIIHTVMVAIIGDEQDLAGERAARDGLVPDELGAATVLVELLEDASPVRCAVPRARRPVLDLAHDHPGIAAVGHDVEALVLVAVAYPAIDGMEPAAAALE